MSFFIVTDSCSDLPNDLTSTYKDFQTLNLSFFIDEKAGDLNMPRSDFYDRLRNGSMSRTSQVNPPEFEDAYRAAIANGFKEILYIGFSSGLSGTYNSGLTAAKTVMAENPDVRILTVDSLSATLGQGMLIDRAVELRDQGKSINEVAQWVETNKLHTAHWFTVDDLNFLKRGGRITASAAWFGTALKIKPVLHVDNEGKLIAMEKKIGRKKALARIAEIVKETGIAPAENTIWISHGDCLDEVEEIMEMITAETGATKFVVTTLGAVIGSHAGPGTIAVFFFATAR